MDEDCLYLNVTTPLATKDRELPVLVWIHGGGFYSGTGGIYGAEDLAARGELVVVTINYRLGVFGFLAHPGLDSAPAEHLSGNFGIEDQQAALGWVKRNARAFGGDPDNVTIAGESAGSISTCIHLTSRTSADLFHRAVMQSGSCTLSRRWPDPAGGTWTQRPRAVAEQTGATLAAAVGCDDPARVAACLRSVPVEALLEASFGGLSYGPVVGGGVIPVDPADAIASGFVKRVPVIHGTTRDEHRTFTGGVESVLGDILTPEEYPDEIANTVGASNLEKVMDQYPLTDYRVDGQVSAGLAASTVWSDYSWSCSALETDRLLASRVPLYAFEFADENAPWFAGVEKPSFPTGAYHAAELQYLFGGAYSPGGLTAEQGALSDLMISYWARFAHSGNPNGPNMPDWPLFAPDRHIVQSLAPGHGGVAQVDLNEAHNCEFWDGLVVPD